MSRALFLQFLNDYSTVDLTRDRTECIINPREPFAPFCLPHR